MSVRITDMRLEVFRRSSARLNVGIVNYISRRSGTGIKQGKIMYPVSSSRNSLWRPIWIATFSSFTIINGYTDCINKLLAIRIAVFAI